MKKIRTAFVYAVLFVALFIFSALVSSAFCQISDNTYLIAICGNLLFIPAPIASVTSLFWKRALKPSEIVRIWAISGLSALIIGSLMAFLLSGSTSLLIGMAAISLIVTINLLRRYQIVVKNEDRPAI